MSGLRGTRSRSVSLAFANFPKPVSHRRSHSSLLGGITRSVRVVILGLGGVGKTGEKSLFSYFCECHLRLSYFAQKIKS